MGLFDKIRDNARDISMKALEATPEDDGAYTEPPSEGGDTAKPAATVAKEVVTEVAEEISETPVVVEKAPAKETAKPKGNHGAAQATKPVLARRSRIIEVSKDKTTYTPHYKSDPNVKVVAAKAEENKRTDEVKAESTKVHIYDVAPLKIQDPVKRALFARERAAMAAMADQRRLSGRVALYTTGHMSFKVRVFVDRVEYSGSFGKNVVPIDIISWVKLRAGGTGVILETIDSKRVVIVVKPKDRLEFAAAILKAQELQPKRVKMKDTKTVRIDELEKYTEDLEEIEKLAKLYDRGILSQDEFETKKKQILGI